MPSIRALVAQKLFESLSEEALSELEDSWRTAASNYLGEDPNGIEVLWLPYVRALNALPVTLDVELSATMLGGVGENRTTSEGLASALMSTLVETPHLEEGTKYGIWVKPFSFSLWQEYEVQSLDHH